MQFFLVLLSFLIFYNSTISHSAQNYNIKPLKIKTFGNYDFDTLEKIKIPENFPTHRAMGREICKSSKGKTWSSSITFYLSKEMLWGVMAHSSSIRVYMSRKTKNNLDLTVYEAAKKWKDQKEWIKGYKVNTKVTNLTLSLKKGLKGVYNSPGGTYWHKCNINFDTINEAKDTLTKSSWITDLSNSQTMALHRMNIFGIKVSQKYDFEFNKSKLDEILVQNVKSNKLPEKKAVKIVEKKDNVSSKKTTYNLKPLKTKSFGNFNFDDLENVNIPDTFPTHKARGWEYCNTRKGRKWSNPITLYLSKDLVWGSMSGKDEIKIYMSSKIKNKLELSVYEAANEWEDTKDWIPGYEVKILNDNLEESLKKGVKGKYISSGGYWRVCKVIFNQIEKAKDVYKQSEWLDLITRSQRMGLIKMSNLGIKVSQKYNFKKLAIKLDKIKTAENERIKKIAEANNRATEIAEAKAKAKKLAEAKAKKLAEEKARKLAEAKAKKLAEEKARKLAEAKAKKLAEEKARKVAEKIKSMKSKAKDFYNDINSFVKSGADIDLIKLSNLYEIKPDPNLKWGKKEIENFLNLENFMITIDGFTAYEKNQALERNIMFANKKKEIIDTLNKNFKELKLLLRENFTNKKLSKNIQYQLNKVNGFLSKEDKKFDIEVGNRIIKESSKFISNIKEELIVVKEIDNDLKVKKIELETILRNNFGNKKGNTASILIKSLKDVNNLSEKKYLKTRIEKFLQSLNVSKTEKQVKNKSLEKVQNNSKTASKEYTIKKNKLVSNQRGQKVIPSLKKIIKERKIDLSIGEKFYGCIETLDYSEDILTGKTGLQNIYLKGTELDGNYHYGHVMLLQESKYYNISKNDPKAPKVGQCFAFTPVSIFTKPGIVISGFADFSKNSFQVDNSIKKINLKDKLNVTEWVEQRIDYGSKMIQLTGKVYDVDHSNRRFKIELFSEKYVQEYNHIVGCYNSKFWKDNKDLKELLKKIKRGDQMTLKGFFGGQTCLGQHNVFEILDIIDFRKGITSKEVKQIIDEYKDKRNKKTADFILKESKKVVDEYLKKKKQSSSMKNNNVKPSWERIQALTPIFIDKSNYAKVNDIITTKIKEEFIFEKKIRGVNYKSYDMVVKINCNKKEIKDLTIEAYDDKGKSKKFKGSGKWVVPEKLSTFHSVLEHVCKF